MILQSNPKEDDETLNIKGVDQGWAKLSRSLRELFFLNFNIAMKKQRAIVPNLSVNIKII